MADPRTATAIRLHDVVKRFGGTTAVDHVNVEVPVADIHGLVGENGAGKSTLGKMVAGVFGADAGTIEIFGEEVRFRSPREALDAGIAMISQEISLVPARSVLDNVFLGRESNRFGLTNRQRLRVRLEELMADSGLRVPVDARAGDLRIAEQQKVEMLRALAREARVIVFDEPTAALSRPDAHALMTTIKDLATRETTVIYVSHFLEEVLDLCTSVTVMRDGAVVKSGPAAEETVSSLVQAMLGRPLSVTFPTKTLPPADAPVRVAARDLSRGDIVKRMSLSIRAGEIVGLAGLVGSGRSEFARLIFGADPRDSGELEIDGRLVRNRHPHEAVANGIAMLPESRKDQGLVMCRSSAENLTMAHLSDVAKAGFVSTPRERAEFDKLAGQLDLRGGGARTQIENLSGGNQQKIAFGKWLVRRPALLVADEPTRGVDVGAKLAIYGLIRDLAAEGVAVLLISSEFEEVIGLSHRIVVMRRGEPVAELAADTVDVDGLTARAFGELAGSGAKGGLA
jgi:ABC-type sugar transport system ATPase subunit